MKKLLFVSIAMAAVAVSFAQAPTAKQAFAELKKLVGSWEMKGPDGSTMKVDYKLTGAGTSLIETQFPGQSFEMVSVYHLDGNKLIMTHYCAAGNQPTMVYKPGKSLKVLDFDFLRGSNMKLTDSHIHSAKIYLLGGDKLKSDWVGWNKGKKDSTVTFDLKKVKA